MAAGTTRRYFVSGRAEFADSNRFDELALRAVDCCRIIWLDKNSWYVVVWHHICMALILGAELSRSRYEIYTIHGHFVIMIINGLMSFAP